MLNIYRLQCHWGSSSSILTENLGSDRWFNNSSVIAICPSIADVSFW